MARSLPRESTLLKANDDPEEGEEVVVVNEDEELATVDP